MANTKPIFITNQPDLEQLLHKWESENVDWIAMDLEGDQGNIHYEYSISIIQLFDKKQAYIIDVLAFKEFDVLRSFLENENINKVMFASFNDQFMAQNVLDCRIKGIRDIAVAQKLLNIQINISNYIGIDKLEKDQHQRANWVRRPISPQLIEYAVNDVLELIRVEEEFQTKLKTAGKYEQYLLECAKLSKQNYKVDPFHLYKRRIGSYKHMNPTRKKRTRLLWMIRELVGKEMDEPVGLLYSKKVIPIWAKKKEDLYTEVERYLSKKNKVPHKISRMKLKALWEQALEMSEKER